jgi:hypothetical protein
MLFDSVSVLDVQSAMVAFLVTILGMSLLAMISPV